MRLLDTHAVIDLLRGGRYEQRSISAITLIEALRGDEEAWANWEDFTNSVKLMYSRWVLDAKREETRARRISEVVRRAAQNIKPS